MHELRKRVFENVLEHALSVSIFVKLKNCL